MENRDVIQQLKKCADLQQKMSEVDCNLLCKPQLLDKELFFEIECGARPSKKEMPRDENLERKVLEQKKTNKKLRWASIICACLVVAFLIPVIVGFSRISTINKLSEDPGESYEHWVQTWRKYSSSNTTSKVISLYLTDGWPKELSDMWEDVEKEWAERGVKGIDWQYVLDNTSPHHITKHIASDSFHNMLFDNIREDYNMSVGFLTFLLMIEIIAVIVGSVLVFKYIKQIKELKETNEKYDQLVKACQEVRCYNEEKYPVELKKWQENAEKRYKKAQETHKREYAEYLKTKEDYQVKFGELSVQLEEENSLLEKKFGIMGCFDYGDVADIMEQGFSFDDANKIAYENYVAIEEARERREREEREERRRIEEFVRQEMHERAREEARRKEEFEREYARKREAEDARRREEENNLSRCRSCDNYNRCSLSAMKNSAGCGGYRPKQFFK